MQQLEDYIVEVCQMEPPVQTHPYMEGGDDPFYPTQVFSNNGGGHQRQISMGSNNERRYAALTEEAMLTADEKVNELTQILEQ